MDNELNGNNLSDLLGEAEDTSSVVSSNEPAEATNEESAAQTANETTAEPVNEVNETPVTEAVEEVNEVAIEETTETPSADTPTEEPAILANDVTTEPLGGDAPKKPSKSGVNKKIIIAAIAAVAVIAAIIIACNASIIANSFRKLVMNSDDYTHYVLKQKGIEYSDAMFERLSNANPSGNNEVTATVNVQLGEDLIDAIHTPDFIDEEAFSDLTLVTNSIKYENYSYVKFSFQGQDNFEVVSFEIIIDTEEQMAYMRCDQLNETYYEIDLSERFDEDQVKSIGDVISTLSQKDIDTLNRLFNKYMEIAINQISDVDEYTETVKIEGVSQKFTALEIEVSEELVANMGVAVFEAMIDDEELGDFVEERLPDDFDYDWDDCCDILDSLIDEAEEADPSDDVMLTLTIYVDNKGEIKGFTEEYEDTDVEISCIEVIHGSKFAFEFTEETRYTEMSLTGVGKMVFGKINADFTLELDDREFTAHLKDGVFNSKKMSGEISFNFEDWCDEAGISLDREEEDLVEDLIVTIKFNFTTDTYSVTIDATNDDGMLVSVTFEAVTKKYKGKLSEPSDTEDDLTSYIEDMDGDELEDNLEEFGFSDDMAETIVVEFMNELERIASFASGDYYGY